jgi:hypothetical protein
VEEQLKKYLGAWIEGVAKDAAQKTGAAREASIKTSVEGRVKLKLIPLLAGAGAVALLSLGLGGRALWKSKSR